MTVLVASADATSATFQYTLADSDSLLVQQGFTLVHSAQSTIIRASTGGHVDVQGTLFGSIRFGGISGIGTGNSVAIGATGAIFGGNDAAVTTTSDASAVHNQGQLSGRVGILMGSEIPGNQNAQVSNDGFILGTEAGIISFLG